MTPAASRTAAAAQPTRLSIGQVLEQLRDEFPDLAHSKLHYLEAEGLICPERTPAGYRKYSPEDVQRIVFVLRAQRDRFWPLRVIKQHLIEHGPDSEVISIAARPGPSATMQAMRLSRFEFLQAAGITVEFLQELEQFGLISEQCTVYRATELDIARSARDLAAVGLHPRHLVMIRTAAEREAHMVRSAANPRSRSHNAAARGQAEDLAQDLGEAIVTLHSALLRDRLR